MVFNYSASQGWLVGNTGWGLHLPNDKPEWLGMATDKINKLFIAKFVQKHPSPWHGYPADYTKRAQDIPHEITVFAWINARLLTKAKARKVLRGIRCNP